MGNTGPSSPGGTGGPGFASGGDELIKGYEVVTVPQPQPLVTGQRGNVAITVEASPSVPFRAAARPENKAKLSASWS